MLSIEILGQIFELISETDKDNANNEKNIAFFTLLRSSRLCSLWREIIINLLLVWVRVVNLNSFA